MSKIEKKGSKAFVKDITILRHHRRSRIGAFNSLNKKMVFKKKKIVIFKLFSEKAENSFIIKS